MGHILGYDTNSGDSMESSEQETYVASFPAYFSMILLPPATIRKRTAHVSWIPTRVFYNMGLMTALQEEEAIILLTIKKFCNIIDFSCNKVTLSSIVIMNEPHHEQ